MLHWDIMMKPINNPAFHPAGTVWKRQKDHPVLAAMAKTALFLLLFFALFGTSMPFRERPQIVEEIESSNIVNQIAYSLVFILSVAALFPKRRELLALMAREKYLTFFLLWCGLSIIWSEFSFVSFKRFFQFVTILTAISAGLLYSDSSHDTLKIFQGLLFVYIVTSLLAILIFPHQATDPLSGWWKGLAPQKNLLGHTALVSTILWFNTLRLSRRVGAAVGSSVLLLASLTLLFGSGSITSILTLLLMALTAAILTMDRLIKPRGFCRFLAIVMSLLALALLISAVYLAPDYLQALSGLIGKDVSLTGRTFLWRDVMMYAREHWLWGSGFQGFWVTENPDVLSLYDQYTWLPNQAHMGYLDMLNETGMVGAILFLMLAIFYFRNLARLKQPHLWKWFFVMALIINISESTFFKARHITGVIFLFAYLALYYDLFKQQKKPNQPHSDTGK